MAAPSYSLPSWLQTDPASSAKTWLTGLQVGASIGEARNRLAQQQQQFNVEAQQKQDTLTGQALKEAQEIQVSKAYNDAQTSLKQQQLKIADEKVGAEIQKAGRLFQAQQAYQKDFQDAVNSGIPEDAAARSAMFKNLSMFGTGAGTSAAIRTAMTPQKPTVPTETIITDAQGRRHKILTHGGVMTDIDRNLGRTQSIDPMQRFQMQQSANIATERRRALQSQINRLQKMQDDDTTGALAAEDKSNNEAAQRRAAPYKARASQIQSLQQQLEGLQQQPNTYTPVQRDQTQAEPASSEVKRVKVISPDGVSGTVREDQLDDALDAGYTQP